MESKIISPNENDWNIWDELVAKSEISSIYQYSSFLKNLDGQVQLILVIFNREIVAGFPIVTKIKFGLSYFLQPMECKYLGPVIDLRLIKNIYERYNFIKNSIDAIIKNIPINLIAQVINCSPSLDYVHPFHWEGYELVYKSTFFLELKEDLEKEFHFRMKREIQHASLFNFSVQFNTENPDDAVSFVFQQMKGLPLSLETNIKKILKDIQKEGKLLISSIKDKDKLIGVAIFFLEKNKNQVYYLYSNYLPDNRQQNPAYLLTYSSITYLKDLGYRTIDFTGLMHKGFEAFWRKFGLTPKGFVQIKKFKNRIIPLILNN